MNESRALVVLGVLCVALCVSPVVCAEAAAKAPEAAKPETAAGTYFLQPKDVVMFFGDSITEGAKPEVDFLMADIKKQYPDLAQGDGQVKMVLSGSGGEVARYGLQRIDKALADFKPSVCVVCYGMNETGWTIENSWQFIPSLKQIVERLKNAKVAVVLAAPPPISVKKLAPGWDRFADAAKRLPATGEMVRKLAATEGVLFVDTFAAFKAASGKGDKEFTRDGVHPNEDGYRVMADALQKTLGFGKPLAKVGTPRPQPAAAAPASNEK